MENEDKKICRIDDKRLAGYEKRTRGGSEQIFYTGSDERDFDRYRAEGGQSKHNVEMHDKPDTIRIQPPEKHYYAQLIEGEWWWVNGCSECNGREPIWDYVKCEKHNVCVTCSKPRKDIKGTAWGHRKGFRCNPCQEAIMTANRQEALEKVASSEYDEWDYYNNDEVVCPHCATSYAPDCETPEGEETCETCGGVYSIEPEFSVTYTTTVVGERLKP